MAVYCIVHTMTHNPDIFDNPDITFSNCATFSWCDLLCLLQTILYSGERFGGISQWYEVSEFCTRHWFPGEHVSVAECTMCSNLWPWGLSSSSTFPPVPHTMWGESLHIRVWSSLSSPEIYGVIVTNAASSSISRTEAIQLKWFHLSWIAGAGAGRSNSGCNFWQGLAWEYSWFTSPSHEKTSDVSALAQMVPKKYSTLKLASLGKSASTCQNLWP